MPILPLDYPGAKILMDVTTPIEEAWRVNSCKKEPWTVAYIERIPEGSWFVDVGANVGPYTLIAAARGLKVCAVEPGYENYAKLCKNLMINHWEERAIVCPAPLGAAQGLEWFRYQDVRAGSAHHVLGVGGDHSFHKMMVFVMTLDSLPCFDGNPVWCKIDVDGTELSVLRGGEGFLAHKDTQGLIIEMQPDETEAPVTQFMADRGWKLTERHQPPGRPACGEFVRA